VEFLLLICTDATAPPYDPADDDIDVWIADVTSRGVHRHGDRLRPPEDATTVTRRGGDVTATPGPFTPSAESIVGYDVIECDSLDVAIDVASRHPMARFGQIEVRPMWPMG
jgi:hypothetical protein